MDPYRLDPPPMLIGLFLEVVASFVPLPLSSMAIEAGEPD
jgi:hypothetical protein